MKLQDDDSFTFPIPVLVQSIDYPKLKGSENGNEGFDRKVSVIHTTHRNLFLGFRSGTVHVLSRETLKLVSIIPFHGGKVSCIDANLEETFVAVASSRGKISLFRAPTSQLDSIAQDQVKASSSICFKLFHSIKNHKAEIKCLSWTKTGNYLFVGDKLGIVTQTDVASLDQFPVPPVTKEILKLESSVEEFKCHFPYLAVRTRTCVVLCDLENEDFTRIQEEKSCPGSMKDVIASGICFTFEPKHHRLQLHVCIKSHNQSFNLLIVDVTGAICSTINLLPDLATLPKVSAFDPEKPCSKFPPGSHQDFGGRLFSIENEQCVLSFGKNSILIYDYETMQLISYCDQYSGIKNPNVLGNYCFFQFGDLIQVLALSDFLSYGQQLLKAGLEIPLKAFISHTIECLKPCNFSNAPADFAIKKLAKLVNHKGNVNKNFSSFVQKHLSLLPELSDSAYFENDSLHIDKFGKNYKQFFDDLSLIANSDKLDVSGVYNSLSTFLQFYTSLGEQPVHQMDVRSSSEFDIFLKSAATFTTQPTLSNLRENIKKLSSLRALNELMSQIFNNYSNFFRGFSENEFVSLIDNVNLPAPVVLLQRMIQTPRVTHWLLDVMNFNRSDLISDFLQTSILLTIYPLLNQQLFNDLIKQLSIVPNIQKRFYLWSILHFINTLYTCNIDQSKTCVLKLIGDSKMPEDVMETIFQNLYCTAINSNDPSSSHVLHHFISFKHFISREESPQSSVQHTLKLIRNSFPWHFWQRQNGRESTDVFIKNPFALRVWVKSSLDDPFDVTLCKCGFPAIYGALPRKNHNSILFEIRLFNIMKKLLWNEKELRNFCFRKGLYPYMTEADYGLQDDDNMCQLILNTGCKKTLRSFRYTNRRLKIFISKLESRPKSPTDENLICIHCGHALVKSDHLAHINWDDLLHWIFQGSKDINEFLTVFENHSGLNTAGIFSRRSLSSILNKATEGTNKAKPFYD